MENDKELTEGCRAGDDAARKELYTRYADRMLAVGYRYTGDLDTAHDVLHDAFIKIFTHFSFRGECALQTWVMRVMVNTAIDHLRREKHFEQIDEVQADTMADEDETEAAARGTDLTGEELMELVAELPEGCRTVFNLYVFEEKSHREIAELLGIKEHSPTSQLHRAKQLLAKRIKEYGKYERTK